MRAIRYLILFGIAAVVLLFGFGMFQQDEMIPTPAEGTAAGNETAQIREDITVEYTILSWVIILGILGIVALLLLMKFGRII